MTDWFARAVLHVRDVEASLLFYVNRLGFTNPWRYDEDGRAHVAQVDRQGCALILADTWPEKIGKGLMFISLNAGPEAQVAALDALRAEFEAKGVSVKEGRGATACWWSMILTAISSSSTIRPRPHPARLPEMKRNRSASPGRDPRRRRRSGSNGGLHSIRSLFSRLCREHKICMFFASFEEPPSEYGITWSKCRLFLLPHRMQLPLSRFQTSILTAAGITLSWSILASGNVARFGWLVGFKD